MLPSEHTVETTLTLDLVRSALLAVLLLVCACESPRGAVTTPPPSPTAPLVSPTPRPTPGPQRYALLYGDYPPSARQPTVVRLLSLNTQATREIARIAWEHDGR